MELQDYLAIIRKRWVSIALITAVVVAGTIVLTLAATPLYRAHAQVYVSVRSAGTTTDLLQGSNFTQRQVSSYADLATSPRVLAPVIEHLDLATTPDELARSVTAESPQERSLINIRVTSPDPRIASAVANSTAGTLADVVQELESSQGAPSPVQISTVRAAAPPAGPSSPNAPLNLAVGLLLGLVLGFGIAVLRELLDTRVRTEDDVRDVTDASVIATIPVDDDARQHPLLTDANPHGQRAESFRRLRTNLQFLDVSGGPQTFVVTSALPGEGKTTTALNLAITLADAGSRVALVDADLRRPSVATYLGLEGTSGLTTVLIGRASTTDVLQTWGGHGLHVLPAGQVPPNPSELLGSAAMAKLLEQLATDHDVVLVDTPPLLPVTDAAILARLTSGALLVAGADTVHRRQLAESVAALEAVDARILGVVLNRLQRPSRETYRYYEYAPVTGKETGARRLAARFGRDSIGRSLAHARDARRRVSRRTYRPAASGAAGSDAATAAEQEGGPVGANRWPPPG